MSAWQELVTLREAVRRTGVSIETLCQARDEGELRVYKLGKRWQRVTWQSLQEWLDRHTIRSQAPPTD